MDTSNRPTGFMRLAAIVVAVAMICAGFYLFVRPASVVLFFSAAVLLHGVQMVFKYLFSKAGRNGWDAIGGIINILFGGIMLFGAAADKIAGLLAIEMFIAIWSIFAGVSQVCGSFTMKKMKMKGWGWMLTGGILTVICGILFVATPVFSTLILVGLAGIYAGIMFLIFGFTTLAGALSSGAPSETLAIEGTVVDTDRENK